MPNVRAHYSNIVRDATDRPHKFSTRSHVTRLLIVIMLRLIVEILIIQYPADTQRVHHALAANKYKRAFTGFRLFDSYCWRLNASVFIQCLYEQMKPIIFHGNERLYMDHSDENAGVWLLSHCRFPQYYIPKCAKYARARIS